MESMAAEVESLLCGGEDAIPYGAYLTATDDLKLQRKEHHRRTNNSAQQAVKQVVPPVQSGAADPFTARVVAPESMGSDADVHAGSLRRAAAMERAKELVWHAVCRGVAPAKVCDLAAEQIQGETGMVIDRAGMAALESLAEGLAGDRKNLRADPGAMRRARNAVEAAMRAGAPPDKAVGHVLRHFFAIEGYYLFQPGDRAALDEHAAQLARAELLRRDRAR